MSAIPKSTSSLARSNASAKSRWIQMGIALFGLYSLILAIPILGLWSELRNARAQAAVASQAATNADTATNPKSDPPSETNPPSQNGPDSSAPPPTFANPPLEPSGPSPAEVATLKTQLAEMQTKLRDTERELEQIRSDRDQLRQQLDQTPKKIEDAVARARDEAKAETKAKYEEFIRNRDRAVVLKWIDSLRATSKVKSHP
ncbi:hypothetical protein [Isosphaera pallida]|nr:hypothetical protein [Isosphaera pallida]